MFPFSPTFLCWGESVFFSFCPFAVPFPPTVLASPPPPCNPTQSLIFSSLALPSEYFSTLLSGNYHSCQLFPFPFPKWSVNSMRTAPSSPPCTAIRSSHHAQEGLRWMKEHGPHHNLQVPALDLRLGFVLLFSRKQHILMIKSLGVEARRDVGGTGLSLKGCCEFSMTNCDRNSTCLVPGGAWEPAAIAVHVLLLQFLWRHIDGDNKSNRHLLSHLDLGHSGDLNSAQLPPWLPFSLAWVLRANRHWMQKQTKPQLKSFQSAGQL